MGQIELLKTDIISLMIKYCPLNNNPYHLIFFKISYQIPNKAHDIIRINLNITIQAVKPQLIKYNHPTCKTTINQPINRNKQPTFYR